MTDPAYDAKLLELIDMRDTFRRLSDACVEKEEGALVFVCNYPAALHVYQTSLLRIVREIAERLAP